MTRLIIGMAIIFSLAMTQWRAALGAQAPEWTERSPYCRIGGCRAFLGALADGESNGRYNALVGGGTFQDYSRHPDVYVRKYDSTSAGAYQFNYPTWRERASLLGLNDFSPHSQDLAAVDTLNQLGAIPKIFSDDIDGAVNAAAKKWESLPTDSNGRSIKGNPRSLDNFKSDYYRRLY